MFLVNITKNFHLTNFLLCFDDDCEREVFSNEIKCLVLTVKFFFFSFFVYVKNYQRHMSILVDPKIKYYLWHRSIFNQTFPVALIYLAKKKYFPGKTFSHFFRVFFFVFSHLTKQVKKIIFHITNFFLYEKISRICKIQRTKVSSRF